MYYCQEITVLNLNFSLIWELAQIICRKFKKAKYLVRNTANIINNYYHILFNILKSHVTSVSLYLNLTNTDIIVPDNSIQLQLDEKEPQNSHSVNNKKTRHFEICCPIGCIWKQHKNWKFKEMNYIYMITKIEKV